MSAPDENAVHAGEGDFADVAAMFVQVIVRFVHASGPSHGSTTRVACALDDALGTADVLAAIVLLARVGAEGAVVVELGWQPRRRTLTTHQ
jgi:hypothetical protein